MSIEGIPDNAPVYWQGWNTTLADLRIMEWEIRRRNRYERRGTRLWPNGYYLYMVNKNDGMLARLTLNQEAAKPTFFIVDFMINARRYVDKTRLCRNRLLSELEFSLSKDDISWLYDIILELQKEYPKPKSVLSTSADILQFLRAA